MLQQMDHPHLSALQRDSFIWSLSNVPLLEGYVYSMDGDPLQEVVKVVIEEFKTSVLPRRHAFRKCTSFTVSNRYLFLSVVIRFTNNTCYTAGLTTTLCIPIEHQRKSQTQLRRCFSTFPQLLPTFALNGPY